VAPVDQRRGTLVTREDSTDVKQKGLKILGVVGNLVATAACPFVAVLFVFHVSCLHSSSPRRHARSENECTMP
jgi:hypothetical protein